MRLAVLSLLLAGCSCGSASVVRVIDGDTVVVDFTTIRLVGIDAPELAGHRTSVCATADAACHCFGAEARTHLRALVINGRAVLVEPRGRDRYGRILAYLSVNGRDVGEQMLRVGAARARDFGHAHPRAAAYAAAEAAARTARLGLWHACPSGP